MDEKQINKPDLTNLANKSSSIYQEFCHSLQNKSLLVAKSRYLQEREKKKRQLKGITDGIQNQTQTFIAMIDCSLDQMPIFKRNKQKKSANQTSTKAKVKSPINHRNQPKHICKIYKIIVFPSNRKNHFYNKTSL